MFFLPKSSVIVLYAILEWGIFVIYLESKVIIESNHVLIVVERIETFKMYMVISTVMIDDERKRI